MQVPDKYATIKEQIKAIYDQHKGRYGYRRVTQTLRRRGSTINHKTAQRLMDELRLKSLVRVKKYRSYRGQVGTVAPNILERHFKASQPNEKWVTDVTEFKVDGKKLYLSPVMDLYNGEILAYSTSRRPLFNMVSTMLNNAFARLGPKDRPLLHSDQGMLGVFNRSSQHRVVDWILDIHLTLRLVSSSRVFFGAWCSAHWRRRGSPGRFIGTGRNPWKSIALDGHSRSRS